ncbi:unnamed protein product [Allacma fusca]|uniref:OTU domain-containing protein n=1 Tax=Allacma fusca TaxID=39272 RepID=A0A8J2NJF5_9HEXA|nr:unnamed protein product [Allacma fusca]
MSRYFQTSNQAPEIKNDSIKIDDDLQLVESKGGKYSVRKVPSDGSCLYGTVVLGLTGNVSDTSLLRLLMIQTILDIKENRTFVRKTLSAPAMMGETHEKSLPSTCTDKEWGREANIYPASHIINRLIHVIAVGDTGWVEMNIKYNANSAFENRKSLQIVFQSLLPHSSTEQLTSINGSYCNNISDDFRIKVTAVGEALLEDVVITGVDSDIVMVDENSQKDPTLQNDEDIDDSGKGNSISKNADDIDTSDGEIHGMRSVSTKDDHVEVKESIDTSESNSSRKTSRWGRYLESKRDDLSNQVNNLIVANQQEIDTRKSKKSNVTSTFQNARNNNDILQTYPSMQTRFDASIGPEDDRFTGLIRNACFDTNKKKVGDFKCRPWNPFYGVRKAASCFP